MPVNGQMNKTRTAKSKGKGLKLKWWYVLPVIVLVAGAGYLIVRFSNAAQLGTLRGGISVGQVAFWKLKRVGWDVPVVSSFGSKDVTNFKAPRLNGKKICAKVFVTNKNDQPIGGSLVVQPYLSTYSSRNQQLEMLSHSVSTSSSFVDNLVSTDISLPNNAYGPFKSTNRPLTLGFQGKNQWLTPCIKIPKTDVAKYSKYNYQPFFAKAAVYTNVKGRAEVEKYPIGVEKIWISN